MYKLMVQISVGNSFSRVTGLTADQDKLLRKELSYVENPDAAYYSGGFVRRKSLIGRRGDFPTGLLSRVQKLLAKSAPTITNRPVEPSSWRPVALRPGIHPWRDQEAAVERALASKRGIVSMPTGTGKTFVAAMIAARIGLKTLIITPTVEIKKQFAEALTAVLTNSTFVTVTNIDDPQLAKMTDFSCLIIDEAHHVAAKTYQRLNRKAWSKIFYRFFITATPFRNQSNEQLLFEAVAGKLIFNLTYKDAVAKGYIVPVEAYYVEIPERKNDYYTWAEVYKNLVVKDVVKNSVISSLLKNLVVAQKSTLCLVKEIEHGEVLSSFSGVSFVHGNSDDRSSIARFNAQDSYGLVGTTGVLGEGVDTKPCEYVIVAGLGKAKSAFMQNVGRAVRKYPGKESAKIILIHDKSHKFTKRHFRVQSKILQEEYGVTPIKLEV